MLSMKNSSILMTCSFSITTFDCSTLYNTLPHDKLKTRLKEIIHKDFSHRNDGSTFVLGYNSTYFSNKLKKVKHATPRNKSSVCWNSSSITYFFSFGGILFQQVVGIPIGTNCAPLPADLFCFPASG
jgi:hypothetical protein